jgi:apolipoprotein D and lipocalin family protein
MKIVLVFSLFLTQLACASVKKNADNKKVARDEPQTVSYVDLERYQGKWYEIASYPKWFQKNCTATTAEYKLKGKKVQVINSCRKKSPDGKLKKAKGVARVSERISNSKLKVQFFLPFLNLSFLQGDYWVIDLDTKNYTYTVISDSKRDSLWILYRKPEMPKDLYDSILQDLEHRGFDLAKLQRTVQK